MFEALSDQLNDTFARLRCKGRLSEADVDAALREVRIALLEADASLRELGSQMVTHHLPASELPRAFEAARDPACTKAVVEHPPSDTN